MLLQNLVTANSELSVRGDKISQLNRHLAPKHHPPHVQPPASTLSDEELRCISTSWLMVTDRPIILGDLFLLSPVMQRWKEQYFVNVGYDCGLTIAGSYYVRFSCMDGSINGYYYDPNSRASQPLGGTFWYSRRNDNKFLPFVIDDSFTSKRRAQARRRGSRPPPPKTTPLIKRKKGKSAQGKLVELEDKATNFFTGKKNALGPLLDADMTYQRWSWSRKLQT
ncbi:vacuolar import/degradation protein Vid24 [Tanacetum coccineum]